MKRLKKVFSKKTDNDKDNRAQIPSSKKTQPTPIEPTAPQTYHHIPLGSGGIISRDPFGNLGRSRTYVGTTATLDTVGVFFEISDTQCFAAHIEAYTTRPTSTEKSHTLNFQTASKLRAAVMARLDKTVSGRHTKRMCDTLVMTCSRLSGKEARVSEVVAKAVSEWLDAGLSGGGRVAAAGAGFVVGWPAGESLVFDQTPGEGWCAVECGIGEGEWSFGVEEREVEGGDEAW